MTHPNAELIRRAYADFGEANVASAVASFSDDIVWHVPGRSPLSGDHNGIAAVLAFFARTMELSQGTFRIQIDDVLAADSQVVVLCTVSAERKGRSWSSAEVHLWRMAGARAVSFREFQGDQQTEDEFWSQ